MSSDPYELCRALIALVAAKHPDLVRPLVLVLRRVHPRRHGPGFASVVWDGKPYTFTAPQARVVEVLWKAHARGTPDVRQELLLDAAGSDGRRLYFLFREKARKAARGREATPERVHPAWGSLIVLGDAKGTFRLQQ